MGLVYCTATFNEGGQFAVKGQVFEDTHDLVQRFPSKFTDPTDVQFTGATNFKVPIINTGGAYATPIALTEAQSGNVILVNDSAGLDFTLPAVAAAQVGTWYRFLVTTTIATNNFRVTAQAGDFLNGSVWIADFDTANTGAYFTADGSSHLAMTMNGSTKGGKKGTCVEFVAISATGWFVTGISVFGDGALATPFS